MKKCQNGKVAQSWTNTFLNISMKRFIFLRCLLASGSVALSAPEVPERGVVMEVWENVKTGMVAELLKEIDKRPPNAIYIQSKVDAHASGMDYYGTRYSALLSVPETGEYTFYLAADDSAEFYLSTDEKPENLQKVCEVGSYMPRHHFAQGRTAGKVRLKRNKKYYMVVNYKDAINDDHVALAWEGPGIEKRIIPKKYFSPVLSDAQRQLWEKTAAREARCKELRTGLLKQKPAKLQKWLDQLSQQDCNLLTQELKRIQSDVQAKGPENIRKRMRPYIRAAAGIKASPETPVTNPVAKTLLHMEEAWLKSLSHEQLLKHGAHRLAESLGKIPQKAEGVNVTLKLDSHGDKWREEYVSTGLYAAPGCEVTVTLPMELIGKRLEMQVGHHFPQKDKPLVCMPDTTRWFRLDKETTRFVTPHGGLMLLKVPREVELRKSPVTISGALKAPRFVLGRDTDADWGKLKNAPAPWGELVSDHIILLVPRESLQKLANPTAVMTWWNDNNRDLEDFFSYYPKVPFRMHAGHYAEEGLSYWPLHWAPENMEYLLNLEAMKKKNSALFLHEHGHHCDFWEMELSFWAESTTNWGGYYLKAREGKAFNWKDSHDVHLRHLFDPNDMGMREIMEDKWYKIDTKGTHHWSYPITTMMIGYAEDFGWDCVKTTIKRIRDTNGEMYRWDFVQGADHDQAKIDRYLIGLSEAAKRDVRPYFAHFKMFPSAGAARYLDNLKLRKWDLSYLVRPDVLQTKAGEPLIIPSGQGQLLSFASGSRIKWKPTSARGGTVSHQRNGNAVYSPKPGFSGVDTLVYVLSNQYGVTVEKKLEVKVD